MKTHLLKELDFITSLTHLFTSISSSSSNTNVITEGMDSNNDNSNMISSYQSTPQSSHLHPNTIQQQQHSYNLLLSNIKQSILNTPQNHKSFGFSREDLLETPESQHNISRSFGPGDNISSTHSSPNNLKLSELETECMSKWNDFIELLHTYITHNTEQNEINHKLKAKFQYFQEETAISKVFSFTLSQYNII